MDKISFNGYRNLSGYSFNYVNWGTKLDGIGFHLTNRNGNHAKEYEFITRRFQPQFDMPAIKFEHIDKQYLPDGSIFREDVFYLNDQELFLCDKNLSIFEKIMKSIQEIKQSKIPFELNKDYMDSPDSFLEFQNSFNYPNEESFKGVSQYIHSSTSIEKGIIQIEEAVNRVMRDYFA